MRAVHERRAPCATVSYHTHIVHFVCRWACLRRARSAQQRWVPACPAVSAGVPWRCRCHPLSLPRICAVRCHAHSLWPLVELLLFQPHLSRLPPHPLLTPSPQIIRGWFGERRAEFEEMGRRCKAIAKPHALFDICRDLNTLVR